MKKRNPQGCITIQLTKKMKNSYRDDQPSSSSPNDSSHLQDEKCSSNDICCYCPSGRCKFEYNSNSSPNESALSLSIARCDVCERLQGCFGLLNEDEPIISSNHWGDRRRYCCRYRQLSQKQTRYRCCGHCHQRQQRQNYHHYHHHHREDNCVLFDRTIQDFGPRKMTTKDCRTIHPCGDPSASSVVRWKPVVPADRFEKKKNNFSCGVGVRFSPVRSLIQIQKISWILVLLLALTFSGSSAAEVSKTNVALSSSTNNGICQSIDIRNNVSQFSRLKGCRVVEGFVQILLIDNADDAAYANLTFPELVEITGYLILYRVNGLKSVGRLFPNLRVIRGNSLLVNYALVAFEMIHLQEIGLHSLTDISRGLVRFEKNPALCHVDTIDWDLIAKAGKGEHIIMGNKPRNTCPVCDKKCPVKPTEPNKNLCWNRHECQKICPKDCGGSSCTSTGKCCHQSCLGGCTGPTAADCIVCRDVITDSDNQTVCQSHCPNGTFEFLNRRCVTADQCRRMIKPRESFNTKEYPYKPFNGTCLIECPAGYMEKENNGSAECIKCEGPCRKECAAANVDSIASAQKLRGCTHITGSLEIQIRGGKNIVKELEDSLSMIEVIDGYLKIVRSFPLISLNFFKNLREISGNTLENGKYTLVVLDNQNLQELWDWNIHKDFALKSKDGPAKVFFHFNPKLCLHTIETLRVKAKLPEFTNYEVAPNSNGDKVACNVTELVAFVSTKLSEVALIDWQAFVHHDPRSLLGYVVYSIEAPYQNVTVYDGRDACGGDGWRVDDVSAIEPMNTSLSTDEHQEPVLLTHILTQLKPYTQYAFYVKTYTIATERSGAQSKIQYFTTMPDAPSVPRHVTAKSNSSSELVLSWLPPLHANGNLTHYRIIGRWEPDDPSFLAQRNYCNEPIIPTSQETNISMEEEENKKLEEELAKSSGSGESCACAVRKADQSMLEKEVSSSIAFEDALHNTVYIKRMNPRNKRDVGELFKKSRIGKRDVTQQQDTVPDKLENGSYVVFERLIPSTEKTFVMRNLKHFAAYNIEVQACRESVPNDAYNTCSTKIMRTSRTSKMEGADDIPPNTFRLKKESANNSFPIIKLYWAEPTAPNGLIITYQIEYSRVDIRDFQATLLCVTREDFANASYSYLLPNLSNGNYSVKVRATSLAGNGQYTEPQYFYIEKYGESSALWTVLGVSISFILILFAFGVLYYTKKSAGNGQGRRLIATVNPEYMSPGYKADEWEVPREKIEIGKELGNGSFGMVYEGIVRNWDKKPEMRCAIKTVNETASERERSEFLNEASVMKTFHAHHVVKLLGVVSQGQPTLVLMELMTNGDLKTYLRSHRPDYCDSFPDKPFMPAEHPVTLKRILKMAVEIADGMAYLTAKKYVHRDLAARNCMVADDLTVKIGDFGMTRDVYETDYYRKGSKGMLPVRWMAPESLKDGVFTSYSDVWSYGVVLWEMVTLGSQPYQGLANDQVLRYVINGGVMERPENCPNSLYQLMRIIWTYQVSKRPTFIDLVTILLEKTSSPEFEQISFYHSPEGIEARNQNQQHSPLNDNGRNFSAPALRYLLEEEPEGEDSPLRGDFGDFASYEPPGIKNSLCPPRFALDSFGEHSNAISQFDNVNSSKVPLKAGFDDFDGVSGVSAQSLASSKDTLNLPFVEDSLNSMKSSSFIDKNTSRGNISQMSAGRSGGSPQSTSKRSYVNSPNFVKNTSTPENRNKRFDRILSNDEKKETVPLKVDFSTIDPIEIVDITDDKKNSKITVNYDNKTETLNNGYISGAPS